MQKIYGDAVKYFELAVKNDSKNKKAEKKLKEVKLLLLKQEKQQSKSKKRLEDFRDVMSKRGKKIIKRFIWSLNIYRQK